MQKSTMSTRKMVVIAMLAAVATVLMYLEMPLPLLPPFLKLDISAVPIMIGSFMYGPVAGVMMAGIKSLIHVLSTQTGGVGELADFIITGSFALTTGLIYRFNKSKKGALIAAVVSVAVSMCVGALANWFLLLPFYEKIMPMEAIIAACSAVNPAVKDAGGYILFGVLPFNFIKGTVVSVLTFILYKRLSVVIHRYTDNGKKAEKGIDNCKAQ